MQHLLSIQSAAEHLAISRRTLEREIADGKIAVIQIRGSRRVAQSDVDAYIARSRRVERWQSTSVATGGTTVSRSTADRSRAALEQALHELLLSSSKRSAERKSQQKADARHGTQSTMPLPAGCATTPAG